MTSARHAFFHSAKVQMLLSIARPMFQFIVWVMPLFTATLTYFIYGGQSPERMFQYAVLGVGFMGLWSSIVFSSAVFIRLLIFNNRYCRYSLCGTAST